MNKKFPNLYLAGAPKCGTTSLYDWLAQHPGIFAPVVKEPSYFCKGLTTRKVLSEDDYLSLYDKRKDENYAIDGSTRYFYDEVSADQIKAAEPAARIIIALRHPAEATHSLFHHLRFAGTETLPDFNSALEAEPAREENQRPLAIGLPDILLYSKVYSIRKNVSRYFANFRPENVKVLLLDDLKADKQATMLDLYNWLGIDPKISVTTDYSIKNGPKKVRSRVLHNLAYHPPGWMGKITAPLFSFETRNKVRLWMGKKNTAPSENPPLGDEARAMLVERHLDDVKWLEDYLQRDLSRWKR